MGVFFTLDTEGKFPFKGASKIYMHHLSRCLDGSRASLIMGHRRFRFITDSTVEIIKGLLSSSRDESPLLQKQDSGRM
ncbi:MAG: hypothetical protein GY696_24770 [Gammaproteobacteria bacterium]|nr:hypothetical protein [Gammaproteobacteria bacterium]